VENQEGDKGTMIQKKDRTRVPAYKARDGQNGKGVGQPRLAKAARHVRGKKVRSSEKSVGGGDQKGSNPRGGR